MEEARDVLDRDVAAGEEPLGDVAPQAQEELLDRHPIGLDEALALPPVGVAQALELVEGEVGVAEVLFEVADEPLDLLGGLAAGEAPGGVFPGLGEKAPGRRFLHTRLPEPRPRRSLGKND